jgi:hypothetical protein
MRRGQGLLLGLLAGLFVGCLTNKPEGSVSFLKHLQPMGPTGPDVVHIEVALIERPVGDRYLNQDLWPLADEQIVGLEQKAVLEENGFRVGQVGGIPPPGLQALLTSATSCANPRLWQMHAGKSKTVMLGSARPLCRFRLQQEGEARSISLEQAQCTLLVVPTLAADGRVQLHFTPQVLHGETNLLPCPAPDNSGWVLQEQRPTELYADLGWEVVLAPNEYVVIGGRLDQPESLGYQCFIDADAPRPVQRLLVMRTGGQAAAPPVDAPAAGVEASGSYGPSAPLALQAGYMAVRGSAP